MPKEWLWQWWKYICVCVQLCVCLIKAIIQQCISMVMCSSVTAVFVLHGHQINKVWCSLFSLIWRFILLPCLLYMTLIFRGMTEIAFIIIFKEKNWAADNIYFEIEHKSLDLKARSMLTVVILLHILQNIFLPSLNLRLFWPDIFSGYKAITCTRCYPRLQLPSLG